MFLAAFTLPESRGTEADLKLWQEAELELDFLCCRHEDRGANEAVYMALMDTHNRCIEERRRAEDLLKLRESGRTEGSAV
jgi:hypothetical protein